jgi:heme/copper-type cytochrome/quinol oxidase subunit 3
VSDDTFLRPAWQNLARQHHAVSFGTWVFLASEVLLFSGLREPAAGWTAWGNQVDKFSHAA